MANKIGLQFKGFEEVIANMEAAGADVKRAIDGSLKSSKGIVTNALQKEIRKHKRTGITEKSLDKDMNVKWEGTTAGVDVGFHIRQGGLPSIFLMYGTPRMEKDQALYDAVYGRKTKRQIAKIQKEAVEKAIKRSMGG